MCVFFVALVCDICLGLNQSLYLPRYLFERMSITITLSVCSFLFICRFNSLINNLFCFGIQSYFFLCLFGYSLYFLCRTRAHTHARTQTRVRVCVCVNVRARACVFVCVCPLSLYFRIALTLLPPEPVTSSSL